jgi:hypothetical protein
LTDELTLFQVTVDGLDDELRLRRPAYAGCGKGSPLPRRCVGKKLLGPPGRLSLRRCAEEDEGTGFGRKAHTFGGFPQVGAAEPRSAKV